MGRTRYENRANPTTGGWSPTRASPKQDDGKVKIVNKHEQSTRKGGWKGAGWGLATGAVLALFPAAAIGGGLIAVTTGGGAAIGAIAGHVSKGMTRGDLKDLGERLDADVKAAEEDQNS